eukprot:747862-Hanusia_phi.AAC.10
MREASSISALDRFPLLPPRGADDSESLLLPMTRSAFSHKDCTRGKVNKTRQARAIQTSETSYRS